MDRRFAALFVFITTLNLLSSVAAAARPEPDVDAGKATFEKSCARCHGVTGAGDGLDAQRLFPKPRNLTLGVYKFRSTASGTPPTDDDIFRTLTDGLPGTRMPDWRVLDDNVRWQLVAYLKTLAPSFQETEPQPVPLAPDPGPKRADAAKGQQLYKDLGCVQCHGAAGRGNGPSAATLVDDWSEPIQAADLTQGWNYRGGDQPRDIALRLLTGIDGTPMPSYVDAIPAEDAWHLAYYVRSIQQPPNWADALLIPRVSALPTALDDAQWEGAVGTDVRLGGIVYDEGRVVPTQINALSVQAVHDGTTVAFRVRWHDRSDSRSTPPDILAMALRSPDMRGDVISLQAWPLPEAPSLDTVVWSADTQAAVEAVDFSFAGPSGVPRESLAAYADGQWTVIVQRPLQPSDVPGAVTLTAEQPIPVAFAAWDGGHEETGRKRSVSYWITLRLQP